MMIRCARPAATWPPAAFSLVRPADTWPPAAFSLVILLKRGVEEFLNITQSLRSLIAVFFKKNNSDQFLIDRGIVHAYNYKYFPRVDHVLTTCWSRDPDHLHTVKRMNNNSRLKLNNVTVSR